VTALALDAHGGPNEVELAALGLRPADVLDFSASTNPFGPPPGVLAALAACDVTRYPDRHATNLREALAAHEGVPSDQVVAGNGAAQLIWAIAVAYLRPGDTAFVVGPTFGEYRVASQLMGARVVEWRAMPERSFAPDLAALAEALVSAQVSMRGVAPRWMKTPRQVEDSGVPDLSGAFSGQMPMPAAAPRRMGTPSRSAVGGQRSVFPGQPRVVWLCNPNNPTGVYLDSTAVTRLRAAAPDALWVLDEAYRPFAAEAWDSRSLIAEGNTLLLRSLTKDCALPGLRLGYALAAAPIIEALTRALPPWSVSSPAIAAGLAALQDYASVRQSLRALRAEAAWLRAALLDRGWRVLPSATNFLLVEVGDAATLRARLLAQHRIQVRDCASFGLPGFIRIGTRRREENGQLLAALRDLSPFSPFPHREGGWGLGDKENHDRQNLDDPGHGLVGGQEPAGDRPVPVVCPPRAARRTLQGAEHEQQRRRDPRGGRNRSRADDTGRGVRHPAPRGHEPGAAQTRSRQPVAGGGAGEKAGIAARPRLLPPQGRAVGGGHGRAGAAA
jgi:histidinol-phosphate/aromatic aminotransferase/cobyric acid decarboxylase-like protein